MAYPVSVGAPESLPIPANQYEPTAQKLNSTFEFFGNDHSSPATRGNTLSPGGNSSSVLAGHTSYGNLHSPLAPSMWHDLALPHDTDDGFAPVMTFSEDPDIGCQASQPAVPVQERRLIKRNLKAPFADNAINYITDLKPAKQLSNGAANGYLKFRLRDPQQITLGSTRDDEDDQDSPVLPRLSYSEPFSVLHYMRLPANFGFNIKLEGDDRKLYRFYTEAWCMGRTILAKSNNWLVDIGPMFESSAVLRHALLSLAGVYVLDYIPNEELRKRANNHYASSVRLLQEALDDASQQGIGQGDALVAAITLLNMHDVVRWEQRRSKNQAPRWLEGARLAARLLDSSDPGYRYYKRRNIQATSARVSNTITVGRAIIPALAVLPLDIANTDKEQYSWLLYGTEREVLRIHAGCGFSPKLMYYFAQVTHFAARSALDPDSRVLIPMVRKLARNISEMRQWSEISPGHESLESLFAACTLDETGVVNTAASMTDLTAEAWRVTVLIYLHCRLRRLPRKHPRIMKLLDLLSEIIKRMPCVGALFTAQAPFLPVFFLGLIGTAPHHRAVAEHWFETVLGATNCRSSVQPAWNSLRRLQKWTDAHLVDDPTLERNFADDYDSGGDSAESSPSMSAHQTPWETNALTAMMLPHSLVYHEPLQETHALWSEARWSAFDRSSISRRYPWWEDVVVHIIATEGTLCLI